YNFGWQTREPIQPKAVIPSLRGPPLTSGAPLFTPSSLMVSFLSLRFFVPREELALFAVISGPLPLLKVCSFSAARQGRVFDAALDLFAFGSRVQILERFSFDLELLGLAARRSPLFHGHVPSL